MPGPREASLHQINHYTSPFVDQLLELWDGIPLRTLIIQKVQPFVQLLLVFPVTCLQDEKYVVTFHIILHATGVIKRQIHLVVLAGLLTWENGSNFVMQTNIGKMQ